MCRISVRLQNLAALTTACMSPHRVKLPKHTEVLFICFATLKVFLRVYCFIRWKSKFYMSLSRSTTLVSLYRSPRECHGVPPFAATRSVIKDKK